MNNSYIHALEQAVHLLELNLNQFTHKFQSSNSEQLFYTASENVEWTTGFCTGQYWLAYEFSKNPVFQEAALIQVDSFYNRIERKIDVDHHDMGFLYTPSCVAAWKLCGSSIGKESALLAADHLMKRFQDKGEFFQAWGSLGAKDNYRFIIDCLLNLPLLYWAGEITGNQEYIRKAKLHTKTSLSHLIREDSSTYHTYYFDPETGMPLQGVTHQGYRNNSAWSRGQAWGIYGLALSYKYTRESACIDLFYKVTDYYLSHLPADLIPYWDLTFTDGSTQPRDSSAAVIAACGILEMCNYLDQDKVSYYRSYAEETAASLLNNGYAVTSPKQSNGLLLHGVYAKSSPFNPVTDRGVDECNTWGDYFYMELLTRLTTDWKPYW